MCNFKSRIVSRNFLISFLEEEKPLKPYMGIIQSENGFESGFDHPMVDVVRPTPDGKWDTDLMQWGFLPSANQFPFLKTTEDVAKFRAGYRKPDGSYQKGYALLDARGDEMLSKQWFKEAAKERRCLVLSSCFYEWRHLPKIGLKGKVLKTPEKYPYRIGVKNQPIFMFAAIWNRFTYHDTGEVVDTVALCTTEANSLMRQIHNTKLRQPTILTPALAEEWISKDLSEERIIQIASYQLPPSEMEAWTLDKDFRKKPDLDTPVKYEEVPDLEVEVLS